jgi:hypothetical protein
MKNNISTEAQQEVGGTRSCLFKDCGCVFAIEYSGTQWIIK